MCPSFRRAVCALGVSILAAGLPARVGALTFALAPELALAQHDSGDRRRSAATGRAAGGRTTRRARRRAHRGGAEPPPGDVIDGLSFFDDASAADTIYFTVSRGSTGIAGPVTPDVFSRRRTSRPASNPINRATSSRPPIRRAVWHPGVNTQVLDGNGRAPLAPLLCYGGYGIRLAEALGRPLRPPTTRSATSIGVRRVAGSLPCCSP